MSENITQNQDLQNFISQISQVEPAAYREEIYHEYQNLIDSGLVTVDAKTIEFVVAPIVHNRPLTPKLFINLDKHIDSGGNLDEGMLRQTVSVSIRLLDACLDAIEMEESIATLVYGSRKIAVCLDGFENYMKLAGSGKSIGGEIDHTGEIVSLSAYQSSITLADEKGECLMWDRFDTKISQKQYEYWHNEETGDMLTSKEIYDNLEDILTDYGTDDIMETPWRIVPRRNSHILGYGLTTDDVWAKWGDRLESNTLTNSQPKDKIFGTDSVYAADGTKAKTQEQTGSESDSLGDSENKSNRVNQESSDMIQNGTDFSGSGVFDSKFTPNKYASNMNATNMSSSSDPNSQGKEGEIDSLDGEIDGQEAYQQAEKRIPLVTASTARLIKKKPAPTVIGNGQDDSQNKRSMLNRHSPIATTDGNITTDGFSLPVGDIYESSINSMGSVDKGEVSTPEHEELVEQGANFFNSDKATKEYYLNNPVDPKNNLSKAQDSEQNGQYKDRSDSRQNQPQRSSQNIPRIYVDHTESQARDCARNNRNQGLLPQKTISEGFGDGSAFGNNPYSANSDAENLENGNKNKPIFKEDFVHENFDNQANIQAARTNTGPNGQQNLSQNLQQDSDESDFYEAMGDDDQSNYNQNVSSKAKNPYQNIEEKGNWFTNLFGFGRSSKKHKEQDREQADFGRDEAEYQDSEAQNPNSNYANSRQSGFSRFNPKESNPNSSSANYSDNKAFDDQPKKSGNGLAVFGLGAGAMVAGALGNNYINSKNVAQNDSKNPSMKNPNSTDQNPVNSSFANSSFDGSGQGGEMKPDGQGYGQNLYQESNPNYGYHDQRDFGDNFVNNPFADQNSDKMKGQNHQGVVGQTEDDLEVEKYSQIPKYVGFESAEKITEKIKNGKIDFSDFQSPEARIDQEDIFRNSQNAYQTYNPVSFEQFQTNPEAVDADMANNLSDKSAFEGFRNEDSGNIFGDNYDVDKAKENQSASNFDNLENKFEDGVDNSQNNDLQNSDSASGALETDLGDTSNNQNGSLNPFDSQGISLFGASSKNPYDTDSESQEQLKTNQMQVSNKFEIGELVKYLGDGKFYQIDDIQGGDYTLVDDQENLIMAKESDLLETNLGEILEKVNQMESAKSDDADMESDLDKESGDGKMDSQNQQNSGNTRKIQELEAENEALKQTLAENEDKIKALEAEVQNLKNLDLELQSLKEEKSLLDGQIQNLENQLARTQAENQELSQKLAEESDKNLNLGSQNQELESSLSAAEKKIQDLENQLSYQNSQKYSQKDKSGDQKVDQNLNPFLTGAAAFGLGGLAGAATKSAKSESQDSEKGEIEKQNQELKSENQNLKTELEKVRIEAEQIKQKQATESQTQSQQKDSIIESLKQQIAQIQMEALQNPRNMGYASQNSSLSDSPNQNPGEKTTLQNLKNKLHFETISQNYKQTTMSKYSLQLQQIVKSNLFQDVIVSINYDGDGPKLVSVESDKFDPSMKHSVDTIMGVVNLGLSKGITPKEMAEQMEMEPKDDNVNETDISHILKLVASSLKQAPAKSNEINPEILNKIAPEMIKEFTKTIKTTVIQLGKGVSGNAGSNDSKSRFSFFGKGGEQVEQQPQAPVESSQESQATSAEYGNGVKYADQNQTQNTYSQDQSANNNNPYNGQDNIQNYDNQYQPAKNNGQNVEQSQDQDDQAQNQNQNEEGGYRRSFFSGFGRH